MLNSYLGNFTGYYHYIPTLSIFTSLTLLSFIKFNFHIIFHENLIALISIVCDRYIFSFNGNPHIVYNR